ncbi:MAG: hypothetical protein ISS01_01690 [Nanoarchaeota archaeon]|nr:hypothetical protein [Nanoarchaeota archaeon]
MKTLIFDSSSLITIAMNNLIWILEPLKKKFKGEFCISASVRNEILDVPLQGKKFKLEAMQLRSEVQKKVLCLREDVSSEELLKVQRIANKIFHARGKPMKVLHEGEIGALLLVKKLNADALVVDERSTRMLIESPRDLAKILQNKMHTPVKIDEKALKQFQELFKDVKIIRSVELGLVAYEMGLFDKYAIDGMKKDVLDGVIWAMRLRGCSISSQEIEEILKLE